MVCIQYTKTPKPRISSHKGLFAKRLLPWDWWTYLFSLCGHTLWGNNCTQIKKQWMYFVINFNMYLPISIFLRKFEYVTYFCRTGSIFNGCNLNWQWFRNIPVRHHFLKLICLSAYKSKLRFLKYKEYSERVLCSNWLFK